MNDTDYVALTETTRDELSDRIGNARNRFDRLIRTADPLARPPGFDWTVHQLSAHVLTVANRYLQLARGQNFHRAVDPAELRVINEAELQAVMAPVPVIADQLRATQDEIDALFDRIDGSTAFEFHCGATVDGITAQTNWLAELLVHGHDIARAARVPWELPERDMLLVLRGMMQIGPAFVRAGLAPKTDICVALRIPTARPYTIHVHDGVAEFREYQSGDRSDAVLRVPASTLPLMLYGRMGPVAAVRHGLRIVGGRRPWKALKLPSCFETG